MRRVPHRPKAGYRRLLGVLALAVVPLTACDPDPADITVLTVETSLSSQNRNLHKVGPADEVVYGWNDLQGTAEVGGQTIGVQLLGNVEYVDGGGPFGGFVTLTFPDGALLALRVVDATAIAKTDTSDARFEGLVRVIGGTGRFLEASGRGVLSGRRNDELGGVVEMKYVVRVEGVQ